LKPKLTVWVKLKTTQPHQTEKHKLTEKIYKTAASAVGKAEEGGVRKLSNAWHLLEYAASYQQSPYHPLQHSKHLCNKSSATPPQQPFLSMLPRSDQKTTPYSTHNSTFLTFNLYLCTVVFTLLLSLYIRLSCNQNTSVISNNVVFNFSCVLPLLFPLPSLFLSFSLFLIASTCNGSSLFLRERIERFQNARAS